MDVDHGWCKHDSGEARVRPIEAADSVSRGGHRPIRVCLVAPSLDVPGGQSLQPRGLKGLPSRHVERGGDETYPNGAMSTAAHAVCRLNRSDSSLARIVLAPSVIHAHVSRRPSSSETP